MKRIISCSFRAENEYIIMDKKAVTAIGGLREKENELINYKVLN